MLEDHIFRVRYQVDSRLITTINLSKRETIEFVAGIGSRKVVEIYKGDGLADPETASSILHAAQEFTEALFQPATNQRFPSADRRQPAAMISPPDNVRSNQQGIRG